jgi:hypothetical protein
MAPIVATAAPISLQALAIGAQQDFSDKYDADAVFQMTGRVLSVQLGSPHSTIQLEVRRDGTRQLWTLHGDNPAQLAATGLTARTLRSADRIVVCGYLPKTSREESNAPTPTDAALQVFAEQITLSDGRKINFASNGPGSCLDPIVPEAANRYNRIPGTGVRTESLPIVPMSTGPVDPTADSPVLSAVRATRPPSVDAPSGPRMQPPVPPSVPTAAVQERIPYDPLEAGYLELYDRQKPVNLTGKVTRVDWTQPNTYIFMTVNNVAWVVETSFIQFRQISVSPAIHVGDTITVSGYLPREKPIQPLPAASYPGVPALLAAQHLARAGQIVLSGFVLNMGTPPTDEEINRRSWCATVRC